jgi:hypothetical protein
MLFYFTLPNAFMYYFSDSILFFMNILHFTYFFRFMYILLISILCFYTDHIYIYICILFFNALYAYFLINTKFFGVLQKGLPSRTHERSEVIIITSWQLYQVLQAFQSMLQLHLIRLCKHWNLFRAAPYIYISNQTVWSLFCCSFFSQCAIWSTGSFLWLP